MFFIIRGKKKQKNHEIERGKMRWSKGASFLLLVELASSQKHMTQGSNNTEKERMPISLIAFPSPI